MKGDPDLTRAKILIIDDDPHIISILTAFLGGEGFTRVRGITDSRLALDEFMKFKPDLVVLDLLMPHVDGFAILAAINKLKSDHHNILILTAKNDRETRLKALEGGAKEFLGKPFDRDEAMARIKNLLKARLRFERLQAENRELERMVRELKSDLGKGSSRSRPRPRRDA